MVQRRGDHPEHDDHHHPQVQRDPTQELVGAQRDVVDVATNPVMKIISVWMPMKTTIQMSTPKWMVARPER